MKKKVLLLVAVAVICCVCVIGNTVAWLIGRAEVDNTFIVGNISIELNETAGKAYSLIPGTKLAKDTALTVRGGSEACWLFVKIEESDDLDTFIIYTPADGWTALEDGVYYREQAAVSSDVTYPIFKDGTLTVKDTVTEAQINALKNSGEYPSLDVKAYAVQQSGIATVLEAWEQAKGLS